MVSVIADNLLEQISREDRLVASRTNVCVGNESEEIFVVGVCEDLMPMR